MSTKCEFAIILPSVEVLSSIDSSVSLLPVSLGNGLCGTFVGLLDAFIVAFEFVSTSDEYNLESSFVICCQMLMPFATCTLWYKKTMCNLVNRQFSNNHNNNYRIIISTLLPRTNCRIFIAIVFITRWTMIYAVTHQTRWHTK